MKRSQKTLVLLHMASNAEKLQALTIPDLGDSIEAAIGIKAQVSTLRGLRADLEWPLLRKKPTKLYTRVDRLEEKLNYLVNQLNIDLPDRLR